MHLPGKYCHSIIINNDRFTKIKTTVDFVFHRKISQEYDVNNEL